ncbi:MAG: dephospho-CoA kinase [Lachnospiraceae bacterium]|nr:dephospho-CoA kinase [Lachnospiraceae bacterium]
MRFIGITGGVGAGKSEILKHLMENPRFLVRQADNIAHSLMEKGKPLFHKVVETLGEDVLSSEGEIDRKKMAEKIFKEPLLKEKINSLIHPAVKDFIREDTVKAAASGKYDIYFLEAALLIECGYGKICEELWYIYADENVRRERLRLNRAYSDEKIELIMKSQLPDSVFRENCAHVIDNSGELDQSIEDIDRLISGYTG